MQYKLELGYPQGSNAAFDSKRQSNVAQIKSKLQGVERVLQKYPIIVILVNPFIGSTLPLTE